MRIAAALVAALLSACVDQREAEDPSDWFDLGDGLNVEEPIAWTTQNYDFPQADGAGIAAQRAKVFPAPRFMIAMAPGARAGLPANLTCDYADDPDLPFEVEGIVTLHPRFYFKTDGCNRNSDEKFYGSYFLQDRTGALFMLGDSKVAHFDMGDRVRVRVRAVRSSFDLDMVYAHDVIEVERSAEPIYYQVQKGPMNLTDNGVVKRITGTVVAEPDTFGQIPLRPDEPFGPCEADPTAQAGCWFVQLDAEINRRGVTVEPGTRLQATGPVLYAYSQFTVAIMRSGQLAVLD